MLQAGPYIALFRKACSQHVRQAQVISSHGKSPELQFGRAKPGVVLVVGVNGGGKTTTIGKLAHKLNAQGAKVRARMP